VQRLRHPSATASATRGRYASVREPQTGNCPRRPTTRRLTHRLQSVA
jgi:hypothetical protein